MKKESLTLFADYFQFYLQDDDPEVGDLSDAWTTEAVSRKLAIVPNTIGVGTARNMDVPVEIQIHDEKPEVKLDEWDLVNQCSFEIKTGKIVIAGCTDYFPKAKRIEVSPDVYQAIICYKGLDSISDDGLDGDDSYMIHLFPGEEIEATTLKEKIG
ncbi:hypothetical protein P4B35_23865 [Pontiellaceae bacterium B12227]|nr:hypothetical protein [Pontiellaceae bacterium B12227]